MSDMSGLTPTPAKDAYVTTWLARQDHHRNESPWEVADDVPLEQLSLLVEHDDSDLKTRNNHNDDEMDYILHFEHESPTYPDEQHPHNIDDSFPRHVHAHRRTISMMNPYTYSPINHSEPYWEQTEPYQLPDHYIDHDLQMQQYRLQHYPYVDQHVQSVSAQHRRHLSAPAAIAPSVVYGPPVRPAHELAWERHNYYQRLQQEEEEQALRLRQERLEQQKRHQEQALIVGQRHVVQDACVARTCSLNRLASPSLLSPETSQILGIGQSNKLSRTAFRSSAMSSTSDNETLDRHPVSITPRGDGNVRRYSEGLPMMITHTMPAEPISRSSICRRKSLKEHFAPTLRSLARRCSSRFGNNGDGRPPSSVMKGEPILECLPEEGHHPSGSRTGSSSPSHHRNSGHMADFTPLQVGPETSEILRQSQQQHEALSPHRSPSPIGDRAPVQRRVSLLRSVTERASSFGSGRTTSTTPSSDITGAKETSAIRKKGSLRFANGTRLDFSRFSKTSSTSSLGDDTTTAAVEKTSADSKALIHARDGSMVSPEMLSSHEKEELEVSESIRKQIVAILSLGRKDSRRRSYASSNATPALSASSSTYCLSPLAVEAQEDLPLPDSQLAFGKHEVSDDSEDEDSEAQSDAKDPREYFAFMLVPKYRYEFQPLVVQ
ncbi:hypothetical protein BGZ98_009020 [Dissophora globulifera]|nr:hypothetical protein BGZ98_009020 [Dissophora globulifera]